jgi:CubicO group peptidase (beta-lactamase class C family)
MRKTKHFRVALLVILAMIPSALLAQSDHPLNEIPGKMQTFVDKGEISGIVALVADREKVLHLSAVGVTDIDSKRPMKTDDIFWIASMSKPITGVTVAILKDEGKLSFDDPVAKHLPEFADIKVAQNGASANPTRPITLRDLMTHTSGLGELTTREPHWTLEQLSKALAKTQLRFQPGTRWSYSTAGIDILGRVVEVVSGVEYGKFIQTRLFDPLGMKETTFAPTAAQAARFAKNYRLNATSNTLEPVEIAYLYKTEITDTQRAPMGGAGLFSTAEDLCRFYQMMLNNGSLNGKTILKPETVAEMTSKQTGNLQARAGMPWGLGFCVIEDPSAMECNNTLMPGTFGHGGAHGTNSWADPKTGDIYILMLQRGGLRNPDNSPMRIEFQIAAAKALAK